MSRTPRHNLILGLVAVAFALVLIFVWIPLDTDTGLLEKVRRQVVIGDALAPTVAGVFILLGGLLVLLTERNTDDCEGISPANLVYLAKAIALTLISVAIMRYAGPLAVWLSNLVTGDDLTYRALRATAPWKWIGYALGGTALVAGFIALTEHKLTLRAILIGLATALFFIAVIDLPFDNLILPPNGDV